MSDRQIEAQKENMDRWNKKYERGQRVVVRPTYGTKEYEAMATTEAYMAYGMAVVFLDSDYDCEVPVETVRAMLPCIYCQHPLAEPFLFETDKGEVVCDDCGRDRNMH